ncbi:MAG: DUF4270 domain-containing protein [Bacteroidota bacterium]
MNYFLSKLPASLLTGILVILVLFSCKKDPYEIGIDLLPPSDTLNVRTTDTCTLEAFSVRQDSTRTDKCSSLILGSMMDPVFGLTTSSFYTQLFLESEGADFGKNPVLDSVVLMLFYEGYYGDTLTRQNVKVYEISEDFFYDSTRFSNQHLGTYPTLLADQDFTPKVKDSVTVYKEKIAPHLRINLNKLTNYLGNKILYAPSGVLASNSAFLKFLKGLYVTAGPVNNKGALLNFSIANGISRMVLYFHDGNEPNNDSLSYNMLLTEYSARFTHIDHNDYLNANQDLKQQILNHDSTQGTKQLFLQGMAGVKIKLKFPFMKNFAQGKILAINDAILELKNLETDTIYSPPSSLSIIRQDSIGRIGYLIDESEGATYFGGTYNSTTRSYFFRLTQHMQKVIMDSYSDHFDLYLVANNPLQSLISPNRIILNGTNPLIPGGLTNRLKLKLTYTVLN